MARKYQQKYGDNITQNITDTTLEILNKTAGNPQLPSIEIVEWLKYLKVRNPGYWRQLLHILNEKNLISSL